jgi:hypothetical protein
MRTFLLALAALSLTATPTLADWQVSSEFKLHLPESTFDKIIQDFWQSLQGTQKVAVGNVTSATRSSPSTASTWP